MSVKVKLRLPVPEGRPGDVVVLSNERAEALVDRRYAVYVSGGSTAPEPAAADDGPSYENESGPAPVTELPATTDKKAEWEAAAAALGIDTEGMTKDEIIAAVGEATD